MGLTGLSGLSGLSMAGRTVNAAPTANLALWLKADAGLYTDNAGTIPATADGDTIGRWADQSGNGYHASQTTAGSRPTLKIINGKRYIRFDGTADNLGSSTLTLGTTCTIYAVVRRGSGTGFRRVISNENNFFLGENITSSVIYRGWASFYGNGSAWGTTATHGNFSHLYNAADTYYLLCSVQSGGTDTAFANGVQVNSRSNSMVAFTDGYTVGSQPGGGGQWWDGDIAEILIYSTNHDSTTRQQVERYLRQVGVGPLVRFHLYQRAKQPGCGKGQ
jgi:hypothetical protein